MITASGCFAYASQSSYSTLLVRPTMESRKHPDGVHIILLFSHFIAGATDPQSREATCLRPLNHFLLRVSTGPVRRFIQFQSACRHPLDLTAVACHLVQTVSLLTWCLQPRSLASPFQSAKHHVPQKEGRMQLSEPYLKVAVSGSLQH